MAILASIFMLGAGNIWMLLGLTPNRTMYHQRFAGVDERSTLYGHNYWVGALFSFSEIIFALFGMYVVMRKDRADTRFFYYLSSGMVGLIGYSSIYVLVDIITHRKGAYAPLCSAFTAFHLVFSIVAFILYFYLMVLVYNLVDDKEEFMAIMADPNMGIPPPLPQQQSPPPYTSQQSMNYGSAPGSGNANHDVYQVTQTLNGQPVNEFRMSVPQGLPQEHVMQGVQQHVVGTGGSIGPGYYGSFDPENPSMHLGSDVQAPQQYQQPQPYVQQQQEYRI